MQRGMVLGLALLTLAALGLGQACNPVKGVSGGEVSASGSGCSTPAGHTGAPKTIEEAISHINALPMPVTVSCFLESLKRPLGVTITSSSVSAQPAFSNRSPRIFVLMGDLVISVVPEGNGSRVVEFSLVDSQLMSVKGEIGFPVTSPLTPGAAYERIRLGSGTSCRFCHFSELSAPDITTGEAFRSQALRPLDHTLINVETMRREWMNCNAVAEPERCAILRGLFGRGEVRPQSFPANMPTI